MVGSSLKGRKVAVVKALVFVAFVVVAIYVVRFTPVKESLTAEALERFLDEEGL